MHISVKLLLNQQNISYLSAQNQSFAALSFNNIRRLNLTLGSKMRNWLLVLLALLAYANQTIANDKIMFQKHIIESNKTKSSLEFTVALPLGYDKTKSYPVIYTTAGRSRFKSLVHQIDWLSHVSMGPMPQFMVVNIPQVTVPSDMHPKFVSASGIANELQLSVLMTDVLPYVEKTFNTQDFRLLEGYSSNGNFVLHTYTSNNALFDGYFAYSPALELDKSGLVNKLNDIEHSALKNYAPLYLSLGPFTGNKALFKAIESGFQNSTNKKFEDFSKHNFLSVATLSVNNSFEWFFSDLSPVAAEFAEGGRQAVQAHYTKLKQKYKKPMDATNTLINLSFHYANSDNKVQALETINAVVESDPDNVYYLTRKALILKKVGDSKQSQQNFLLAKSLATKTNNDDALSYIKGELSKFQSE